MKENNDEHLQREQIESSTINHFTLVQVCRVAFLVKFLVTLFNGSYETFDSVKH
ncbi:unnamed protein product, partial [Rotaria sp. Silwood1]